VLRGWGGLLEIMGLKMTRKSIRQVYIQGAGGRGLQILGAGLVKL